jgi:hypothetical protein
MGRRVIVTGKKTHAKGETFEIGTKDRYYVNVSLLSLKTQKDYDIDKGGEFYFKVHRGTGHNRRVPDMGEIHLQANQGFEARQDFTLWTEFIQLKQGDEKQMELEIGLYERDVLKDDTVFEEKLPIKLGGESDYLILQNEDGKTKAKLKIAANRTRY